MNQFVAPQFIDVEDRIIGPITTRQFVMMVIGGVIIFASYKILDAGGFALTTFIVLVVVFVFGFIKINGRRFYDYVKSMLEALRRPKVRVWYKKVSLLEVNSKMDTKATENVKTDLTPRMKTVHPRHLSELALIVDTGGRYTGH